MHYSQNRTRSSSNDQANEESHLSVLEDKWATLRAEPSVFLNSTSACDPTFLHTQHHLPELHHWRSGEKQSFIGLYWQRQQLFLIPVSNPTFISFNTKTIFLCLLCLCTCLLQGLALLLWATGASLWTDLTIGPPDKVCSCISLYCHPTLALSLTLLLHLWWQV